MKRIVGLKKLQPLICLNHSLLPPVFPTMQQIINVRLGIADLPKIIDSLMLEERLDIISIPHSFQWSTIQYGIYVHM